MKSDALTLIIKCATKSVSLFFFFLSASFYKCVLKINRFSSFFSITFFFFLVWSNRLFYTQILGLFTTKPRRQAHVKVSRGRRHLSIARPVRSTDLEPLESTKQSCKNCCCLVARCRYTVRHCQREEAILAGVDILVTVHILSYYSAKKRRRRDNALTVFG